MFKQVLVLFVALSAACAQDLQLVLEDNFNSFDLSLWQHQLTLGGGGNWEFEYYTNNRSNSYVKDGVLYLQPTLMADDIGTSALSSATLDIWGATPADYCTGPAFYGCMRQGGAGGNILNPVKSASLRTAESFFFKYGKVEVRAQLPKGDWLWPAIWLMPRWNNYGNWPASGEIDIMESRGNAPSYPPGGRDKFGSTLHWGPDWSTNSFNKTHQIYTSSGDLSDDFHVYGLVWNETYIGTYLDTEDQVVLSTSINQSFWELGGWGTTRHNPWEGRGKNAPFDAEMYLIINVAVGGTNSYFPDGYGKPWNNGDPHSINAFWAGHAQWYPTWTQPMAIDYVKVWSQKKDRSEKDGSLGDGAAYGQEAWVNDRAPQGGL